MAIDLTTETTVPVAQAAKLFPNPRPSRSTLWRYVLRGKGQRKIKLESILNGTHRVTTQGAVDRFIAAINTPETAPRQQAALTPAQRRKQAEVANKALEKAGL